MTEGGDIGFRIYHIASSSNNEEVVEVVPVSRIESHLVMEEGEIVCDYIGKCEALYYTNDFRTDLYNYFGITDVVAFENGFSFFRSKKVHYHIDIDAIIGWWLMS